MYKFRINRFYRDASNFNKLYFVTFLPRDLKPENNIFGVAIVQDELVFASKKVECVGQIIGAIVAKDQATAQRAAKKVLYTMQYE